MVNSCKFAQILIKICLTSRWIHAILVADESKLVLGAESPMAMPKCTHCFKARFEVNEHGVCGKCEARIRRKHDTHIHIKYKNDSMLMPFLQSGKFLSKERWASIKLKIDKFYASTSMDDIERYNASIQKKERNIVPSASAGYLYLLRSNVGYYKIGRTINVDVRVGQHLRDYPVTLDVVHVVVVPDMIRYESWLLSKFSDRKMQGEWFSLSDDDVNWIKSLDEEAIMDAISDGEY